MALQPYPNYFEGKYYNKLPSFKENMGSTLFSVLEIKVCKFKKIEISERKWRKRRLTKISF
jgi:hypothetical protein